MHKTTGSTTTKSSAPKGGWPSHFNYANKEGVMNSRLGSGQRFSALESSLSKDPNVRNPEAVAASIGMKRYGPKRMAQMAAKGRANG